VCEESTSWAWSEAHQAQAKRRDHCRVDLKAEPMGAVMKPPAKAKFKRKRTPARVYVLIYDNINGAYVSAGTLTFAWTNGRTAEARVRQWNKEMSAGHGAKYRVVTYKRERGGK
jgi:hypothetical protein